MWHTYIPLNQSYFAAHDPTLANTNPFWCVAPPLSLQKKVDNTLGTKNNVVTVKTSDFEVFEALACDSVSLGQEKSGKPRRPFQYKDHLTQYGDSHYKDQGPVSI